MPTPLRMKRINDRMKEVLSVLLISKIDDPPGWRFSHGCESRSRTGFC